jgi:hypothetical protein
MATRAKTVTRLRPPARGERTFTAELTRVDSDGRVFVREEGCAEQAVLVLNGTALREALVPGARVLLLAHDGGATLPILLGVVEERLAAAKQAASRTCEVNGRKIHLTGDEEIRLTCGRSTIVLTRDGRVTVRGARIVTRAAETNRVKGGTVEIN